MIIEVANIKFNMSGLKKEDLNERAAYEDYLRENDKADVDITVTSEEIDRTQKEFALRDKKRCRETALVRKLYEKLIDFDGFVMHAASISVRGDAYAFSASRGTGKSTHMNLWKGKFAEDYRIINGDRTVFRRDQAGKIYACGSPWCGKEKWNSDIMVPTKGICYIERSEKNWARRLEASEAFEKLLNSTLMPMDPGKINSLLVLIDWVARNVPVYAAGVNMNPEAADVVYEAMARL